MFMNYYVTLPALLKKSAQSKTMTACSFYIVMGTRDCGTLLYNIAMKFFAHVVATIVGL